MSGLNAASKRFLDHIFGDAAKAWLAVGRHDAKDKLVMVPGREGPAGTFDLPDDMDLYYCIGTVGPVGRKDVRRVHALVIDDVGKEIDAFGFRSFFPLKGIWRESSAGSHQVAVKIKGGMEPDEFRALRMAMRANPIWGNAHNVGAAAIYRLPQGTHTKSTRGGFKPRDVEWADDEYTPEEIWKALAPAGAVRALPKGSANDRIPAGELLADLLALIPNDKWDWDRLVNVGRAVWGASDGLADAEYHAWAAKYPGNDPVVTQARWDSYHDASIGRFWLLREARSADPAGAEAWLAREAAAAFDDGVDVTAAEAAVVPMFTVDDFRSVVGEAEFIHVGTGKFWKPASVDAKVPAMARGQGTIKATAWMRAHRYVTELSWLPGRERIVEDCSMGSSGMERRLMHSIFNLYQAPVRRPVVGPVDAGPWLALVRRLWPLEADDILRWFAHRVQRPGEKCNHALVLGGAPGIGKDTVLEGVRRAVGEANCCNILPNDLRASFNDYVKSVLLVVNELRDDGAMSQYAFYDKSKTLIAAPPSTMTINSKYLKTYTVPNVCGVVMTTNYKQTGMYLPADDRRHLVCWSEADAIAEGDTEFPATWAWMNSGGFDHIAEWLWTLDLSGFDPKAPPRKTQAFLDIVAAAGSSEERALLDKIEALGKPKILRIADLKSGASGAFDEDAAGLDAWLADPKYRKVVAEALDRRGYRQLRNSGQQDGRWKVGRKNEFVYGRKDVDVRELRALAGKLSNINEEGGGAA